MDSSSEKYRSRQVFYPQIQSGVFPFPLRKFFREVFLTVQMPILGTWRHSSAKMHFNDHHYYLKICHIGCFWYFLYWGTDARSMYIVMAGMRKSIMKIQKLPKLTEEPWNWCILVKKLYEPFLISKVLISSSLLSKICLIRV